MGDRRRTTTSTQASTFVLHLVPGARCTRCASCDV
ncbi:MAG: hypothetical protein JNM94_18005 [Phycisphaerae bacterium]|nr:hypothetical protein [Phycisphaerae bacterium]